MSYKRVLGNNEKGRQKYARYQTLHSLVPIFTTLNYFLERVRVTCKCLFRTFRMICAIFVILRLHIDAKRGRS